MTKTIQIKGTEALIANLKIYDKNMTDAVADGLRKFGGLVESESTRRVPVDTGELRSRVFNEGPMKDGAEYTQVVGYEKFGGDWSLGNAYAVAVHERVEIRHRVGEAKFLENAVNALAGEYAVYLKKLLSGVRL